MHAIKSDWNTQGHEKQKKQKKKTSSVYFYTVCLSLLFFLTHRDEPLKPPTALQNRKPVSPSQRVSCGLHQDLSKVTIERDRAEKKNNV